MPKAKTVGIQSKPEVDLDELERLRAEEEAKADELIKKAELGEEEEEEQEEEENQEPPKKEPKKPEIDWKKKAAESAKEALVLKAQLDQIEEEKNKKVEITDEFLKEKYPDWEDLTTGEQTALRKAEVLEQKIAEMENKSNQFNNDRKWQEKVEAFVTEDLTDLFPKIVGREEEFKRFATRPTRKGLPLDDLAKIFLFENPAPEPKKGSLFHKPGGGDAPKSEGMSADDIRVLRVTRPLEYMRLVRLGKIKIKI